ncbi:MAG: tRNA (N(6)-L-threonylcarbamoyladenosine(37)-C(2))-methylthiotransferase MtaB [Eubacteriales bacterium]|nr:tRNA (N(6)-L-threonylcarbamoyladenosine(37)-C(2))-methylthiotransferase MtaB [Eubacteriales bacterium]
MTTVAFHTLGCKTNHYETDALRQQFLSAGFEEVPFHASADVYILNTCTVTGEADRKSRQMLHRARRLNEDALIVALGCATELGLQDDAADLHLGTRQKSAAFRQVMQMLSGSLQPAADITIADDGSAFDEWGAVSHQSETRGYVKIEDGCDNHCAYCAITLARGPVRSRRPDQVIGEAKALAEAGYREIVLTGIHICSYGLEWNRPGEHLMELAADLAGIPGIDRIRLGSLEPRSITPGFLALARQNPKLCPHFHLSLQSGSDTVLGRMRRQYQTSHYREVVDELRRHFDDPGITTDIIVGFPGETEQEHADSLAFCREIGFSRMHVFRYSAREGTAAASMPDQVDPQIMIRRSDDMSKLADRLAAACHQRLIGKTVSLIVEKQLPDGSFSGYSERYLPISLSSDEALCPGDLVLATVRSADAAGLQCSGAKRVKA